MPSEAMGLSSGRELEDKLTGLVKVQSTGRNVTFGMGQLYISFGKSSCSSNHPITIVDPCVNKARR